MKFVEKIRAMGGRVFLVGGWVRDTWRKAAAKDKDYVLVGVEEKNFCENFPLAQRVGRAFPVYLLEIGGKTVEIAFARREKKTGMGYTGFSVVYDAQVTIEEDLQRRDTTMNSLAMELPEGRLLDLFGGCRDIENHTIRAISGHFVEDPVRALRAARQAAELGFQVTEDTLSYMRQCRTELAGEPQERIFHELERSLQAEQPSLFFRILAQAGLLKTVFPEIFALQGKSQPIEFHPEGDAFAHTMQLVDEVAAHTSHTAARFAGLVHDLGKGTTPLEMLPHHYGHEARGLLELKKWNARSSLPREWMKCGNFIIREHMRAPLLKKTGKIVDLLLAIQQSPLGFTDFNAIICADHGSLPPYLQEYERYIAAILEISGRACPAEITGPAVGEWLRSARSRACWKIMQKNE